MIRLGIAIIATVLISAQIIQEDPETKQLMLMAEKRQEKQKRAVNHTPFNWPIEIRLIQKVIVSNGQKQLKNGNRLIIHCKEANTCVKCPYQGEVMKVEGTKITIKHIIEGGTTIIIEYSSIAPKIKKGDIVKQNESIGATMNNKLVLDSTLPIHDLFEHAKIEIEFRECMC